MGQGKRAMTVGEFVQYCTGCDAICSGYAYESGWEEERCVFCGSHMDGFRVLKGAMSE